MSTRKMKNLLAALLALAFALSACTSFSSFLRPESTLIFELDPSRYAAAVDQATLETAARVLENRARDRGYTNADCTVNSNGQILINLPEKDATPELIETLTTISLLEFVDMSPLLPEQVYVLEQNKTLLQTSYRPDSLLFGGNAQERTSQVFTTVLTGEHITNAQVTTNQAADQYEIIFELDADGTQIFREFTSSHTGSILAIVVDKRIVSAPTINSTIPDGHGVITGNFTFEMANTLATHLRSGAMPIPLILVAGGDNNP